MLTGRKIAFISEHASPLTILGGVDNGGQNVYVAQLSKQLAALGYQVDIFTRWDNKQMPQIVNWSSGVRVVHVKAGPKNYIRKEELLPFMGEFTRNMLKFIDSNNISYQLIHANFFMSAMVAADIKRTLNIPFVVTFHALGKIRRIYQKQVDEFPEDRLRIEEEIVLEADKIIAECPQDREDLIKYYNVDTSKIIIVPCGFDPQEFHPADKVLARTVLGLNQKEKIILHLGRIVPRKGIDNILKALAIIQKKQKNNIRLVIVGGETDNPKLDRSTEMARLIKMAREKNILSQVTFVGRKGRETLKYYYSCADVFVTTPWYEPFGITPLEAMACGVPVIGSRVGGIKYSVLDGKTGYLIPSQDPKTLAKKILEILMNEKLSNIFKENALKRVNTMFTWSRIANLIVPIYENILLMSLKQKYGSIQQLDILAKNYDEYIEVINHSRNSLRIPILDTARSICRSILNGNRILVCGNFEVAADSQHLCTELVGYLQGINYTELSMASLVTDSAFLSAGKSDDVLIGISTNENYEDLIKVFKMAHKNKMICIGILGKDGDKLLEFCDIAIVVPSDNTQRIQEVQMHILHTICELIENQLHLVKEVTTTKHNGHIFPIDPKLIIEPIEL